jgi:hypothetical protein
MGVFEVVIGEIKLYLLVLSLLPFLLFFPFEVSLPSLVGVH